MKVLGSPRGIWRHHLLTMPALAHLRPYMTGLGIKGRFRLSRRVTVRWYPTIMERVIRLAQGVAIIAATMPNMRPGYFTLDLRRCQGIVFQVMMMLTPAGGSVTSSCGYALPW